MKNALLVLICSLGIAVSPLKASELVISMQDQSFFYVVLDNQLINNNTNWYHLNNVTPGLRHIQIYKVSPNSLWGGSYPVLFYSSSIQVPANKKMTVMINPFRDMKIMGVESLNNFGGGYGHGGGHGHGNHGNNGGYYGSGYGNAGYCAPVGMGVYEFSALKQMLAKTAFDSSKLSIAKQAIAGSYISAAQVAELMHMLSFESSKLELAKFAYSRVIDPQNYFLVNNAFSFSSSIDELHAFIMGF